jgi:serine/tyrosine/threonine adenylyltransferase
MTPLAFKNSYASLSDDFYTMLSPTPIRDAWLIHANDALANAIGISKAQLYSQEMLECASGATIFPGMQPLSQVYSGHQFGQWAGQLGDGRGILLGELNGHDLHLKGAGKTPYSRFGDGRAVLRSSIREYLCGEYMHQLGIPTSRALTLVGSNEPVWRENYESAAMIIRTAESHVRFGHFEHFHYTDRPERVRELADFVIEHHFAGVDDYASWFSVVVKRTAKLMAQWQIAGFTHGVMNTDNMSILGITLDYGPYGFLDDYVANFVCNHSDHHGRYAFDRQPSIGLWNLNALAMALSSLIDSSALTASLAQYEPVLVASYVEGMAKRLGLDTTSDDSHESLIAELLSLLEKEQCDYHQALRKLAENEADFAALFNKQNPRPWIEKYLAVRKHSNMTKEQQLNRNPLVILRNHLAQRVIDAASQGDATPLASFFEALQHPYSMPNNTAWLDLPTPDDKGIALSCSS